MDRYLTQQEIELYKRKGINLEGEELISYRFSALVNAKRVDFFNMALNKFLNDKMTYEYKLIFSDFLTTYKVECIKEMDDNYYQVKSNNSSKFFAQKQDGTYFLTEEDVIIEGVEHKRINFIFANSHPLIVVKILTDLKDAVSFVDQMYQYDHDGNEYLRMKYPIGSNLRFISSGAALSLAGVISSGSMVDVMGYEYNRDKFEVEYFVSGDDGLYFISPESELYIDRDENISNLLGD